MKRPKIRFGIISVVLLSLISVFAGPVLAAETSGSHYQETADYGEIASFLQENWEDDYYTEAVIDTKKQTVEVDGKTLAGDEWIDGLENNMDSAESVREFMEAEGKVCEITEDGKDLTVVSPYQSKRLVVKTDILNVDFGAEEVLHNIAGGKFYLRYTTEEQTKEAFEQLSKQYGANVFVDQILKKDILMEDDSDVSTNAVQLNDWGIEMQGLAPYLSKAYSRKLKVAVIDTGCDTAHSVFKGRICSDSFDFESNKAVVNKDTYGHGTHVAGIIAASTPKNVELMILDVFNSYDESSLELINTAFEYCMDHGADLVNCSFGTEATDYAEKLWGTTLAKLKNKGIMVVCSSGNDYMTCENSDSAYPASFSSTLAVSAITKKKTLSSYSNYGSCIDFAGPGDAILSAYLGGVSRYMNGTSMACPNVVSALSCIKLEMPAASSYDKILNKAVSCSEDLGTAGKDTKFGYGLINLKNFKISAEDLYPESQPTNQPETSLKSISGWNITVPTVTYSGAARKPAITVKEGGKTIPSNYYSVSYMNNINAGTATVVVKGRNGFTGTRKVTFKIAPKSISGITAASISARTYSGNAFKPTPTIKDNTRILKNGTDFKYTYKNNVNAGTGKVIITGIGNYTGTKTLTFKIKAKKITPAVTLSTANYTYNGKTKTPAVTVKYGGKTLKKGTDYSLLYASGRKNVGKYSVKVTLKGNYSGSKTVSFKINPKGTSLKSLTAGSKRFTAKWSRQSTQTTGYQIRYRAETASVQNGKIVTVKGTKNLSKTVKNLSAKKKYYVRVRTYKTVNGINYYSAWSAAKSVTTKQ